MEEILKGLLALGPGGLIAAICFWFYVQERTERRELGAKLMQLIADGIEAEKDMTAALGTLSSKLKVGP